MTSTLHLLLHTFRKFSPIWFLAVLTAGVVSQGFSESAYAATTKARVVSFTVTAPSTVPVQAELEDSGNARSFARLAALSAIQLSVSLNQQRFLAAAGVCIEEYPDEDTVTYRFEPAIPVVTNAPAHGSLTFGTIGLTTTCGTTTQVRTFAAIYYTWTDASAFRGTQDAFSAEWSYPGKDNFGANSWIATRADGENPPPPDETTAQKGLGSSDGNPGGCSTLDPCNIGNGNSYEEIIDYTTAGQNRLSFRRFYNSLATDNTFAEALGSRWRSNYDRYLDITPTTVTAERADGQVLHFTMSNGAWTGPTDIDISLTNNGVTWTLTNRDETVETYTQLNSGQALLQTITARNGYTQTLDYNVSMQLTRVTDSYGRQLNFTYNGDGMLTQVTTPGALTLSYGYGADGMLVSVSYNTNPATQQVYSYVNQFDLASVTDENGNVFASWTYDTQHRALSNQHANGADLVTISYDSDTTRTVSNALGQQTVYTFAVLQGVPKVTGITRTATATVPAASQSFTYDANGYTASMTDWNGNVTTFVNDSRGNPTSITEASGTPQARTTTITYAGPRGRQPGTITAPRLTTAFIYDAAGNVLTRTETDTSGGSTNGQARTWAFTYDNTGHMLTATNPLSAVTAFTYDGDNVATVTDALGHVSRITSYNGSGLPLSMTDANGVETTFTYDARNRPLSRTIHDASGQLPPQDATTNFGYDAVGNITAITLPGGAQLLYTYDAAHRVTAVTNNSGERINYTLDALGGITQTQVRGAAITQTQSAVFDSLGRMLRQIGAYNETTSLAYDAVGNLLTATDALNHTATRSFDALNRLVSSANPLQNTAAYAYDAQGNLASVTDPRGLVTTYTYNGFGDIITQSSPDTGTKAWTLDTAGNRISETDARGVVTNRTFDKLNRALTETYPAAPEDNVSFTYDEGRFGIGMLTSFRDRSGSTAFVYDGRGNVIIDTRKIGQQTYITSYSYDLADRITGITYPDKRSISYARDSVGRISGVSMKNQGNSAKSIVSSVTYEPFGPIRGMVFGNGIAARLTRDLNYRLTGISAQGSAAIQSLTMAYDSVNDITSITDFITANDNVKGRNASSLSHSQNFTYDANRRLLTAIGAYGSQSFAYDADGNRIGQTDVTGDATASSAYAYPANSNRLSGVSGAQTMAFTYTASGGTATETAPQAGNWYAQSFTYDSRDRNIAVSVQDGNRRGNTTYSYNALGQRVSKERTGAGRDHQESRGHARYIYDQQGHLIAEATDGQSTKNYVYIGDLPVAVMDGGNIYYIHADHLGAPQKMTDDRQQIVWDRVSKSFGETVAAAGMATLNLRFPGQYHDAETGLDYNYFRSYNPALGRYTQSDPIGLAGGINTFGYVGQNPVNLIDPSGLCYLNLFNQGALGAFGGGSDTLHNALLQGSTSDQIAAWLGFTVGYSNQVIYTAAASLTGSAAVGAGLRGLLTAGGSGPSSLLQRYLAGSGGRWGSTTTRALNDKIATNLESQGYRVTGGAGRAAEEWIPGAGGKTTGGTFVDLTVTNGTSTVRVQTVTTLADGVTLTQAEAAAAARIRAAFPSDTLLLIPK